MKIKPKVKKFSNGGSSADSLIIYNNSQRNRRDLRNTPDLDTWNHYQANTPAVNTALENLRRSNGRLPTPQSNFTRDFDEIHSGTVPMYRRPIGSVNTLENSEREATNRGIRIASEERQRRRNSSQDSLDLYNEYEEMYNRGNTQGGWIPATESDLSHSINNTRQGLTNSRTIPFSEISPSSYFQFTDGSGVYPRYTKPTNLPIKQRPKEQLINIQPAKPDLLQGSNQQLEFNPIPFKQGTYFSKPISNQNEPISKEDMNKKDYFSKTGKPLGRFGDGGKNVNTLEGDLYSKVLMNRNKNLDFVQRANAVGEYPESNMFMQFDPNEFGQKNSHLMSWGEDDNGQAYMSPTIFNDKNEAIKIPNQYADYISSTGYKNATGIPKKQNGGSVNQWSFVKDDLPKAGNGYKWSDDKSTTKPIMQPQNNVNISQTTGNRNLTTKEVEANRVSMEAYNKNQVQEEYNSRKNRIQESIQAQSQPISLKNLQTQSQSTGDKFSLSMNSKYGNPEQYPTASQYINALDYVNPAKFVGDMASGLGSVPQDVKEGNYLKAGLSVATPLTVGAIAGIGTTNTKQFLNNTFNPLVGIENPLKIKSNAKNKSLVEKTYDVYENTDAINTIETPSFYTRNPSAFTNRNRVSDYVDRNYTDLRLSDDYTNLVNGLPAQHYPHLNLEQNAFEQNSLQIRRNLRGNRYDLDSDVDYERFMDNNQNQWRPEGGWGQIPITEQNINTTRISDLHPNILESIDLRKYKNLNINELTLVNKSLGERVKNLLSDKYRILKNKARIQDRKLGNFIDNTILNKSEKLENIVKIANDNLKNGVGVSKGKFDLQLKVHPSYPKEVALVYVDGVQTGEISLPTIAKNRKLSQIFLGNNNKEFGFENAKFMGRRKTRDYPFSSAEDEKKFTGTGVSGEINKAISEALKSKGERLYSGGTGHTKAGAKRYKSLLDKDKIEILNQNDEIFMYKKNGGKVNSGWQIIE